MKTVVLTLFTLVTLSSFKASAQDVNVSAAVSNAFHSSFRQASDVQWKEAGSYVKADFVLNGQFVSAFYDQQGTLVAVTKNISPIQLPVTLQASLRTAYEDYWISDVFELSDQNGTLYYATVENGDTKITLKSVSGNWTTFRKKRKS